MDSAFQKTEIRYGSYSESPIISSEFCIPNLYGITKINICNHDSVEIIMGISPKKSFSIEIYLTNEFGKIIHLGTTEFIDFLNNLQSFCSINIDCILKPPILSISKVHNSDVYEIKFINHEKVYMKEKAVYKLCEMKKYLISMINELKTDIMMYERCYNEIVVRCRDFISMNMSKKEIIDHLLKTSDEQLPKKVILETVLNFIDYCLIYAVR